MKHIIASLSAIAATLAASAAVAGSTIPIPVSEPGLIGLAAGAIVAVVAVAKFRSK